MHLLRRQNGISLVTLLLLSSPPGRLLRRQGPGPVDGPLGGLYGKVVDALNQPYAMPNFGAAGPMPTIPGITPGYDPNRVAPGQTFTAPDISQFAAQIQALEDATYQRGFNRFDPYYEDQRKSLDQRLVNQGIPIGSEASTSAKDRFGRERGDALENLALSSIGAGRQEHGRLFNQSMASTGFNASEQARNFQERLASEGQYGSGKRAAQQFLAAQKASIYGAQKGQYDTKASQAAASASAKNKAKEQAKSDFDWAAKYFYPTVPTG